MHALYVDMLWHCDVYMADKKILWRISLSFHVQYEDITRPRKVSFHPEGTGSSTPRLIPVLYRWWYSICIIFDWYSHLYIYIYYLYKIIYLYAIAIIYMCVRGNTIFGGPPMRARARHASRGPRPIIHNRDRRKSGTMARVVQRYTPTSDDRYTRTREPRARPRKQWREQYWKPRGRPNGRKRE